MHKYRLMAALVCIIFLSSTVLITFANADWAMFRSDPSHSGAGTGSSVLTPTVLWNYSTPNHPIYGSPAVANGVVYIGLYDGLYAFNATNGAKLWTYKTYDVSSSPAVVGGMVYVGAGDGNVYALDAYSGAKLWNYTTGNVVGPSPAVAGGAVYVGSYDGNVYAFNATNGFKLWNFTCPRFGDNGGRFRPLPLLTTG